MIEILYETILSEGRIEDAKQKWYKGVLNQVSTMVTDDTDDDMISDFSDQVIDEFITGDPSGNNKYLDWMLQNFVSFGDNFDSTDPLDLVNDILSDVTYFHNNIKKFKNKDILSYTGGELKSTIDQLKLIPTRKEVKEKGSEVIYKKDQYRVIRPVTIEGSCFYGSGTKWCISMKSDNTQFNQYTKNSLFFFVIDLNKDMDDPTYKVAIRKYYTGKTEYWNSLDQEFNNTEVGTEWWESLPDDLKNSISTYFTNLLNDRKKDRGDVGIQDEKILALIEAYAFDIDNEDEIIEEAYTHYGMSVYNVDGVKYAVGTVDEADTMLRDYCESYIDEVGISGIHNLHKYLMVSKTDIHLISSEDADYRLDDMSTEDIISESDYNDEYDELINEKDDLESEFDDLDPDNDDDANKGVEIQSRLTEINDRIDEIERLSKEELRDKYYDDISDRLENDLLDYLWEMGYVNKDRNSGRYTIEDKLPSFVQIDNNKVVDDMMDDGYGIASSYDGEYESVTVNDTKYITLRIN